MSTTLKLPRADRSLVDYTPGPPPAYPVHSGAFRSRTVYAAAHVCVTRWPT